MTVIVSVKINEGIVLASDSAVSFVGGQIYQHENKIVNLVKGLPIGVMACGLGNIGNASIVTLLKDLRRRFTGADEAYSEWMIDGHNYTMEFISFRVHAFFEERRKEVDAKGFLLLRVCGYSSGHQLAEVWQVGFEDGDPPSQVVCNQKEDEFGCRWNGEQEAMNRLILGIGTIPEAGLKELNLTAEQVAETVRKVVPAHCRAHNHARRPGSRCDRFSAIHGGNNHRVYEIRGQ